MAFHHQAVVLELKRDLVVAVLQASMFCTDAPPSIHKPAIAQYRLADLARENDVVLELNLSSTGILQKYRHSLLPQNWDLSPLCIL